MSVRDKRLCDVTTSGFSSVTPCDDPSVGTCVLCDRDACARHALHPNGGLVLKLESIIHVDGSPPRDVPWGSSAQNPNGYTYPTYTLFVCRECRTALGDPGQTHLAAAVITDLLKDVSASLVKKMRAKLAELKMTAKK